MVNQMYGCDIDEFIASVVGSFTYEVGGVNMIVAGLMSDAQEQMAFGDIEGARQSLNRAKALLFRAMESKL
jgi:hypothetical protein